MYEERDDFELAARAVVHGDLAALNEALTRAPDLVARRSGDRFRATLLHFVAANGVPDELQRTPANAVQVARLLLERGADPDAASAGCGSGPGGTPLCLLVSSWHPFERGVQAELVRELVRGGAHPNGAEGEGLPLATALVFGFTRAAEALVESGAKADHPLAAAGLGRTAELRAWFAGPWPPMERACKWTPPLGGALGWERESVLQQALHLAVTHGRLECLTWLLGAGASPEGRSAGQHSELPLLQAVFAREFEAARRLLAAGANPDRLCPKRGETARDHALGIDPQLPAALGS
jgi:ankyrin repeat protein